MLLLVLVLPFELVFYPSSWLSYLFRLEHSEQDLFPLQTKYLLLLLLVVVVLFVLWSCQLESPEHPSTDPSLLPPTPCCSLGSVDFSFWSYREEGN